MRTTLALDDDIFAYARTHAQRERISIGEAVSRLARQGIVAQGSPRVTRAQPKPKSKYDRTLLRDIDAVAQQLCQYRQHHHTPFIWRDVLALFHADRVDPLNMDITALIQTVENCVDFLLT